MSVIACFHRFGESREVEALSCSHPFWCQKEMMCCSKQQSTFQRHLATLRLRQLLVNMSSGLNVMVHILQFCNSCMTASLVTHFTILPLQRMTFARRMFISCPTIPLCCKPVVGNLITFSPCHSAPVWVGAAVVVVLPFLPLFAAFGRLMVLVVVVPDAAVDSMSTSPSVAVGGSKQFQPDLW